MGVSLAWHLTRRGWRDVVLVEKSELTAGLDMARGRALHPLRASPHDHGDARGLGAPVPGRAAGGDRRERRISPLRCASRHPLGRADGRVPPRAGARAVHGPRVPHPHPRGAGASLSPGPHRGAARRDPRAGRRARRSDAGHPGARRGGRVPEAPRSGATPRCGRSSATHRTRGRCIPTGTPSAAGTWSTRRAPGAGRSVR